MIKPAKACTNCGSTKNGFTKSRTSRDGLNSRCRICTRTQSNKQYAKRVGRAVRPQRTQVSYVKHGKSSEPEYVIWAGMKDRCLNQNAPAYKNYGGRGIKICDEWIKSFTTFLEHVGRRPSPKHTIERENNDGNYEPGNVRWATMREQGRNKRSTRLITIGAETLCASDWANKVNIPRGTVLARLSMGYDVAEALRPPPQNRPCERCSTVFKPGYKSQRFCSPVCRTRAASKRFKINHRKQKEIQSCI